MLIGLAIGNSYNTALKPPSFLCNEKTLIDIYNNIVNSCEVLLGLESIPIHIVELLRTEETKPSQEDSSKPMKENTHQEEPSDKPPTS